MPNDKLWVPAKLNQFKVGSKTRQGMIKDQKNELISSIGKAQATLLLQQTPKSEIRKRQGAGGKQFSYVEHAYVTETLNWATLMDWDIVVIEREKHGDEVLVHGYLEVRFPKKTIRKYGTGGAKVRNNPALPPISSAYKAATSDLLKVCAARLGLGLDLYRSDDSRQYTEEEPQVQAPTDNNDPATTVQLDTLKNLGMKDIPDNMTKGQARSKIKELYERNKK